MKLYSRADFMRLPEGVIFCKGKPWYFETLMVKGETLTNAKGKPIDFGCRDLINIEMGRDSGEWAFRLEKMLQLGESYPLNEDYGRDGCFDDEEIFLVYEARDLHSLRRAVQIAQDLCVPS